MQLGLPFSELPDRTEPSEPPERYEPPEPSGPSEPSEPSEPIFIFFRHKRARRYLLRVDHDGRVRVTIPRGGSKREAEEFARRNREWIARQQSRLSRPMFSVEERRALRIRARVDLPARLLELAAAHGLYLTRISVRNQRTRWGSCGRDGHICLNWRLVLMPDAVRDYVMIHELMHLRRLDHSPAYWRLVEAACPGYREARQWLRLNGAALR